MNALDEITCSTGAGFSPTLRSELARQPWLTEHERIAAAVAAAGMGKYEDMLEEEKDKSYEDGRKDGKSDREPELNDLRERLTAVAELLTELHVFACADHQQAIEEELDAIKELEC